MQSPVMLETRSSWGSSMRSSTTSGSSFCQMKTRSSVVCDTGRREPGGRRIDHGEGRGGGEEEEKRKKKANDGGSEAINPRGCSSAISSRTLGTTTTQQQAAAVVSFHSETHPAETVGQFPTLFFIQGGEVTIAGQVVKYQRLVRGVC